MDKVLFRIDDWLKVLMELEIIGKKGGHSSTTTEIASLPNLAKFCQNLAPKVTIKKSSLGKAIIILREAIGPELKGI